MRYFSVNNNVLSEYFGVIKSNAEMSIFKTYNGTKPVDRLTLNSKGVIVELTDDEYRALHPFDPTQHIFSKYRVKEELRAITTENGSNAWADVKKTITEDQYENMMLAQDFNLSNKEFKLFYDQLKATKLDIDAILEKCVLQ